MKFGKIENISAVDFTMPKDPLRTSQLLAALPTREGLPLVYSGCTGWAMKEWVGSYYPKGTKSSDFLLEYAKQFNTIELNSTHYSIPGEALIKKWVAQSPEHFKFSPKIPQVISHSRDLGLSSHYIEVFCEAVLGLGSRLGVSFMQLPPNFEPKHLKILELFLQRFPTKSVALAIEIRHEAWFENAQEMNNLNELLQHYAVGTVMSDVAGRRDALHLELTTNSAMIRFVGNDLHESDYLRIDAWIERLKTWFDAGLHSVYFFQHQPENLLAPDMAVYFNKKMNEVCGLHLKIAKKYDDSQMSLF